MTQNPRIAASAVVFAYHDIGVRCLAALLEMGVDIKLVVTHKDNPSELIWFDSVEELALRNGITVITPSKPNSADIIEQVAACKPDFIFSFYFREMLGQRLLDIPVKGAFNMHGSLLPKYRGRVPVNWAIIHGEKQCGVSLHKMVIKPDAGDLAGQKAVSILQNDTAYDVFQKLKCAAESLLLEVMPGLVDGTIEPLVMDLASGSYFGGRRPDDGRIDWKHSAKKTHDLIRAVAPPFPGAFFNIGAHRVQVLSSYFQDQTARFEMPCIYVEDGRLQADCVDGKRFMITEMNINGEEAGVSLFEAVFGPFLRLDRDNIS